MKFFRQTKETKRKLSFFMALAMVISLLPVSPIAKAAEETKDVTLEVYSEIKNAKVTEVKNNATGSAVITLESSVANKGISAASITATVVSGNVTTKSAISSKSAIVTVSSPSAVQANNIDISEPAIAEGVCKVTISKITTGTAILLSGSVTLTNPDTDPTDDPADPTDDPADPTDKPVQKHKVNVTNKVGDNIALTVGTDTIPKTGKELSVDEGTKLEVAVAPDGDFIWAEDPELIIDETKKPFDTTSTKYTSEVTISKDTAIVVSGGSVTTIPDDVVEKVENAIKPDTNNISGTGMELTGITSDIISAIAKDNKGVTAGAIVEALNNDSSTISTVYKISKSTSKAAISAIENGYSNDMDKISKEDYVEAVKNGYAVDIEIEAIYDITVGETKITGTIAITLLKDEVTITMPIPENLSDKKDANGDFYAFRLHDGKVTAIKCDKTNDGKIKFVSNQFSTYVISFVPKTNDASPSPSTKPTKTPGGNSGSSGGIGSYVSAAPSASPSAEPTKAPGADNTATPGASSTPGIGDNTPAPTKVPTATNKPSDNTTGSTAVVKVGKKATISGSQYKVTAVKGTRTVQFTKGKKNTKSIVIPSTVKISGKNYKVTAIAKNAFKGNKKLTKVTIGKNVNKIGASAFQKCSKLKSIIIKSTKLTNKKVGKNAFKGINKKATFKVPKNKVKAYKKIVKAKGAGKNVKVKK